MTLESVGKYRILGSIGEGAMGVVYKAHDPFLNRYVAIKMISASLKADSELRERFQREAQAAASLNHPNIVTVHDFGEEQGKIFMAMELLEGTDLREVIGNPTQRRLEDKLGIMEQVCDGLAFAHAKQIVHRDLKPGNIHILPNGQVKIMDFGLARLGSSDMTATGLVMGTPNYMSPEQVMGERVDVRSDVFSLGAVFYELLTNRKPFEADSVHGVLYRVVHKEPPPVRQYAPSVPNILVSVVEKALNKDKARRFQDAGQMREALTQVSQALSAGRADEATLHEMLELEEVQGADATEAGGSATDQPATWVEGTVALDTKQPPGTSATQTTQPAAPPAVTRRARPPAAARAGAVARPRPAKAEEGIKSRLPLYLGGGAALAALTALALISFKPERGPEGGPRDVTREVGALTKALVRTQVELAARDLEDKDYTKAISQAQQALDLVPRQPEALAILEKAQGIQADLEGAATEARSAFDAGDTNKASEALSRVLALDPKHPVAAELSAQLNKFFRTKADEARKAMERSREQAQKVDAGSVEGATFSEAAAGAREAETLFARAEFAVATRRFLESRDAFDRAKRAAEAKAAPPPVTAPPVSAPPTAPPATSPPVTTPPTMAPPPPTLPPVPRRSFRTGTTSAVGPPKKGVSVPKGFEPPRDPAHPGDILFEVSPSDVRPGDHYTLKIVLVNKGSEPIKIKGLSAATKVNGGRAIPLANAPQSKQVPANERGVLLEVPGVWPEGVNTWRLDVIVSSDRGDEYRNQLTLM